MWYKILFILLLTASGLYAQQKEEQLAYVEKYKALAVLEMERSGIPASIKLGQAVLESRWGTTDLARIANNHFGIKCGGVWNGPSYDKVDDEYDRNGNLIPSCFREYNNPEESFLAHSAFLHDPTKQDRYGFLFKLDLTDYKAWARGLRKAGYATDPDYHHKLIRIIESLELYRYDKVTFEEVLAGRFPPANLRPYLEPIQPLAVMVQNDVAYTIAKPGEKLADVAERTDVPVKSLLSYNETLDNPSEVLSSGARVYLQHKRNSYRGHEKWHTIKDGERMFEVSQRYGVSLAKLYERNRLPLNSEVEGGERVKLRGSKVSDPPKLRTKPKVIVSTTRPSSGPAATPTSTPAKPTKPDPFLNPAVNGPSAAGSMGVSPPIEAKPSLDPLDPSKVPQTTEPVVPVYHVVLAGETLWSVSRKYNLSVETLKSLNEMRDDKIVPGMALRVK